MNQFDNDYNTVDETFSDKYFANLSAQIDARHILEQTEESELNYPNFDKQLKNKVTHLAYAELMTGCSLFERGDHDRGRKYLERAGKIIGDAYLYEKDDDIFNFHLLIGALSLYASNQYSRAYVMLRKVHGSDPISQMVLAFLQKDLNRLEEISTKVYFEFEQNNEFTTEKELARVFLSFIIFVRLGKRSVIEYSYHVLNVLLELSHIDFNPENWIIVRLIKIILFTFEQASPWTILPKYVKSDALLDSYIKILSSLKRPIIELWPSQIESIKTIFDNSGSAVINLKTSGGKTRVAEISIINSIIQNRNGIILYVAPFKTLASEVEFSFEDIFGKLNISVSNIYGGANATNDDIERISRSQIVIATPEKIKAISRSNPSVFDRLSLVIFDEGHLIGSDKRAIKNEIFNTHLVSFCRNKGTKIIVLSAVLPNASDISKWISGNERAVASSEWKPSLERLGTLTWDKEKVNLDWNSDIKLFNNRFVEKRKYGKHKYPKNKQEAVAATAIKLSKAGPVMIYTARANAIKGLADAVLLGYELLQINESFDWGDNNWERFEIICKEELEESDYIIEAAKHGVICHSNNLPVNVRIAIEQLIRKRTPNIIIASPTLAQGVNIGISTVIIYTPYIDSNPISNRDFWNVCGRAGRAYSDSEGKILYTIDLTDNSYTKNKNYRLRDRYFSHSMEEVKSGIKDLLDRTIALSTNKGIPITDLYDLLAENTCFDDELSQSIYQEWNWIDDELLSIGADVNSILEFEKLLKESLMCIQANRNESEKYINIATARLTGLKKRISSVSREKSIIASGMEINTAERILDNLDELALIAQQYIVYKETKDESILVNCFELIDNWIKENAQSICEKVPTKEVGSIREKWILGESLIVERSENNDVNKFIGAYYTNTVPWLLNSVSQVMAINNKEEFHTAFSEMACLSECGLPTMQSVYIYYAGIRSRHIACELDKKSIIVADSIEKAKNLIYQLDLKMDSLSEDARKYISALLVKKKAEKNNEKMQYFSIKVPIKNMPDLLFIRSFNSESYLMSSDSYMTYKIKPENTALFDKIAKRHNYYFERVEDFYQMKSFLE